MGLENKLNDEGKLLSNAVETLGVIGTTALEGVRTKYINPKYFEILTSQRFNAPSEVSGLPKEILQHAGDFWEGYIYSFILYNTLSFLFPRMSEKTKLGISLGLSNLVIAAVESGLVTGQKPDYADIPAGVLGSLAYLGVHYIGKNIGKKISTSATNI